MEREMTPDDRDASPTDHLAMVGALEAIKPADPFPDEKARPCWRVYDGWMERGARKHAPGVYRHEIKAKGDDTQLIDTWICDPLHVIAKTRDATSSAWGRLLRWHDADGVTHQWAMPMSLLESDGADMRRELAHQGLNIAPGR